LPAARLDYRRIDSGSLCGRHRRSARSFGAGCIRALDRRKQGSRRGSLALFFLISLGDLLLLCLERVDLLRIRGRGPRR